jgi:DNA invertase Pin-like site-specific DNA recombinase
LRIPGHFAGEIREVVGRFLQDRVKAGIAQARKEGRPHGRPKTAAKLVPEMKQLFLYLCSAAYRHYRVTPPLVKNCTQQMVHKRDAAG